MSDPNVAGHYHPQFWHMVIKTVTKFCIVIKLYERKNCLAEILRHKRTICLR